MTSFPFILDETHLAAATGATAASILAPRTVVFSGTPTAYVSSRRLANANTDPNHALVAKSEKAGTA
jgi:hypothetical protein